MLGNPDNHKRNMGSRFVAYYDYFFLNIMIIIIPYTLVNFLNQLDNVGTEGEDERGRRIDRRSIF